MHKRRASKSTLLLMELVMVIFIFALCAAVCLGLFGTSQKMTNDSDSLNHAVAVSRTAANCYKAANGDLQQLAALMDVPADLHEQQMRVYYDKRWQPASQAAEDGFYLLIVSDTDTALRTAEMAVCHTDGTMIYQLEVKKAVLHAGGELYAAE